MFLRQNAAKNRFNNLCPCQTLLLKHLCESEFCRDVSHGAPVLWMSGSCVDCLTGRLDGWIDEECSLDVG